MQEHFDKLYSWADPEGGGGGGQQVQSPPSGKSQVATGFLRNSGTDHSREAIGPLGDQLLVKGGRYGPP